MRTPPPLQKKRKKERKDDKNSQDISVLKDLTSKILPYDIMNLFINGVPRDLDRQNNNCTHVQHTFFNIYLPTTTTTRRYLILRFMEDNIKQQQTGVRIEQGQWVGIVAIKIERTRICFLSEMLAASPSLDFNKVPTIQRKQGIKLQPKKSALFKVDQLCQSDVHQRAMVGAIGTRKINPPFRHNFGLSYDNFTP